MVKIIGICGSPREGNTEFMLRTVLGKAKGLNAETELFLLKEKNIQLLRMLQEYFKWQDLIIETVLYGRNQMIILESLRGGK